MGGWGPIFSGKFHYFFFLNPSLRDWQVEACPELSTDQPQLVVVIVVVLFVVTLVKQTPGLRLEIFQRFYSDNHMLNHSAA